MLRDPLHRLIDLFEFKRSYQRQTSGLKPGPMHVLEFISAHAPVKTLDIGKQCGIPAASLIDSLDKLESRGLVNRERSASDKRVVLIESTPLGAELVALHKKEDKAFLRNLMKGLCAAERKTLASILEKMLGAIDTDTLFKE